MCRGSQLKKYAPDYCYCISRGPKYYRCNNWQTTSITSRRIKPTFKTDQGVTTCFYPHFLEQWLSRRQCCQQTSSTSMQDIQVQVNSKTNVLCSTLWTSKLVAQSNDTTEETSRSSQESKVRHVKLFTAKLKAGRPRFASLHSFLHFPFPLTQIQVWE